jgi:hypothetical protein
VTILKTTPEDEASGLTAKIYDGDIKSLDLDRPPSLSTELQEAPSGPGM